jgi:hypothetical protein
VLASSRLYKSINFSNHCANYSSYIAYRDTNIFYHHYQGYITSQILPYIYILSKFLPWAVRCNATSHQSSCSSFSLVQKFPVGLGLFVGHRLDRLRHVQTKGQSFKGSTVDKCSPPSAPLTFRVVYIPPIIFLCTRCYFASL